MSDYEKGAAMMAVVLSIGAHLLGFLAIVLLITSGVMQDAVARVAAPEEYIVIRPEMLLIEDPPQKEQQFIKSIPGRPAPELPPETTTSNIAMEDMRAASMEEVPPTAVSEEDAIALAGALEHAMDVADRDFVDGPEQTTPAAEAGRPSPPALEELAVVKPLFALSEEASAQKEVLEDLFVGPFLPLPEMLDGAGKMSQQAAKEQVQERPPAPQETAPVAAPPDNARDSAFVPKMRKRRLSGSITNKGAPSLNAKATPTGKYIAEVTREIERHWRAEVDAHREFVTYANLRVNFSIDRRGKIHDLHITRAEANAVIKDFTLSAILDAEIPPIPDDLWNTLEAEQIEMNYDVVIY